MKAIRPTTEATSERDGGAPTDRDRFEVAPQPALTGSPGRSATASTVRRGSGCTMFATWGANVGEETSTSAAWLRQRPPRRRQAPRRVMRTRRRTRRRGWTGAPRHRRSACRRSDTGPVLWRVVESAGGLVEEQQLRAGGELDREGEGEPLPLREVPRVRVAVDAGGQRPRGSARVAPGSASRSAARHSAETESQEEQVEGVVGDKDRLPPGLLRAQVGWIDGRLARCPHPDGARAAAPEALEGPQQGGLAGAVAAHDGRDLAAEDGQADPSDRVGVQRPTACAATRGVRGHRRRPGALSGCARRAGGMIGRWPSIRRAELRALGAGHPGRTGAAGPSRRVARAR